MRLINSFRTAQALLNDFVNDADNIKKTEIIARDLAAVFAHQGKVIICGNGGSAADAMHFAEEFTGRFRKDRRPLPAMALCDPTHITCTANDYGFDYVFSRGVEAFGQAGDMLIVLSTSGNSTNLIKAVAQAQKNKMKTVAFLGKDGGLIKNTCDYEFIIPGTTSDRVQEIHMLILHIIIEGVEAILFA